MKHCFGSREELSVEIKELEKYFEKTSYSSKDPTDMLWGEVQIWSKDLNLFERGEDNFVVVPLGQLANWIFNSWKYISYHNYGSKDSLDQRFCPSGKCSMHDRYDSWEFNWPEHEPLKRGMFSTFEKSSIKATFSKEAESMECRTYQFIGSRVTLSLKVATKRIQHFLCKSSTTTMA